MIGMKLIACLFSVETSPSALPRTRSLSFSIPLEQSLTFLFASLSPSLIVSVSQV